MNKQMKVVIIGGVAAGPKAASKVIRMCPEADVTLIEKGEFLSYAGCGLPYYISGVVKDQKELMSTPVGTVRDSVFFQNVKNIHVCNYTEAVDIDRSKQEVTVKDWRTREIRSIQYDKLLLATGATPLKPPVEGIKLNNIFTLHGVEDAEGIKSAFSERKARDVTIVGGGLIGIEMAEAFHKMGARVTIIEALPQILSFLDWEIAQLVTKHLESKGVKVKINTKVTAFKGTGNVEKVLTDKGENACDIVIMAVGVRPNVTLAKNAGLYLGSEGGIKVNEYMQTSDPNIYAAGDCVETMNRITRKLCFMPLGSIANKQGRIAALNICGQKEKFQGILNTAICKVFDFGVAATGLSERKAKEEGFQVITVLSPAPDRAHFYPTAKPIMMKLIVDKISNRLLGTQVVGFGDVAKRIDIAVTAITANMTVDDVSNLDLAYAPPYSAAMDNIITAANIAKNKLVRAYTSITPMEVKEKIDNGDDFIFLDVRTQGEYDAMRLENTTLITLGKLRGSLSELQKDAEIITFCKISLRGYEAALILQANGFTNVKVMDGGILMWPYKVIK